MLRAANVPRVIRRVRKRLGLSQGALARRLNATNGTIQHWERGRNRPCLARLLALQQICPHGPERRQLEALIIQTKMRAAHTEVDADAEDVREARWSGGSADASAAFPTNEGESLRLRRQVARLQTILHEKNTQLRVLRDRTVALCRQVVVLRANQPSGPTKGISK